MHNNSDNVSVFDALPDEDGVDMMAQSISESLTSFGLRHHRRHTKPTD